MVVAKATHAFTNGCIHSVEVLMGAFADCGAAIQLLRVVRVHLVANQNFLMELIDSTAVLRSDDETAFQGRGTHTFTTTHSVGVLLLDEWHVALIPLVQGY